MNYDKEPIDVLPGDTWWEAFYFNRLYQYRGNSFRVITPSELGAWRPHATLSDAVDITANRARDICEAWGRRWVEESHTGAPSPTAMNLADLRVQNDSRAARWNRGTPAPLSFAMMELAGEVGEACNVAKKLAREEMGWVGGSTDTSALAEELADVVICADLAASRAGIDLAAAVAAKFNKTSEKHGFPERLPTGPGASGTGAHA